MREEREKKHIFSCLPFVLPKNENKNENEIEMIA